MMKHDVCRLLLIALGFLQLGSIAWADRRPARPPVPGGGAGGVVNLPYTVNDNAGNQWMIYQGGWLRQNGNMPAYSQAAMLMINNNGIASHNNTANRDPQTGEIIFENMQAHGTGVSITRRILINNEDGYVRYIDVFKNTQGQDASINVSIQTNFNFGVMTSETINDPKRKDRAMAWVAQLHGGRAILEVYGGRGVKDSPDIGLMPDNNMIRASQQITVPAGKEVAIVHLHGTANTQQAAQQFVNAIKENKLLADVPRELRKIIVNFGSGSTFIDDREILRGDLFDVVELRSGDLVKGTLKEPVYKLETFYGTVELPAERVVGLMNIGQFRPRQLVVTSEGEVFGGYLSKETIELELSSGQTTQIPLTQIARVGYRKRPGEPEEWTFDKPLVMLRTGERVGVVAPDQPVEVLTRYGLLRLRTASIAAVDLQAEDHGVHQVYLTDGSAFAGLLNAPAFEMKLSGPSTQPVTFPASTIRRLQFRSVSEEPDPEETPTLALANEDLLVGVLTGRLKLDTTFDTIDLDASEVRRLTRAPEAAGLDVQVTLWDQTVVSGQLQQPQLECALYSGVQVSVPIALVEEYSNPNPKPSAPMVERIKAIVLQLSDEDWKTREAAEAQLASMGPSVATVLRELLPSQPPEAQQRIEAILKQLGKSVEAPEPPAPQPMELVPEG